MLGKFLANQFVLQPTTHSLEHEGLTRMTFPYSRGEIEAFVGERRKVGDVWHSGEWNPQANNHPDLLVLKLPGTAGRAEKSTLFPADLVENVSSEVWTWNPPGYGRSSGRATLAGIASAAVEFFSRVVEERCGEQTCVWLNGNSLGCATSLYLATQLPVHGLILRNPPPLVDIIRTRNAWWNLGLAGIVVASGVPHEMDAVAMATRVTAPIVFIESAADTLVPPSMQALIRDSHPGQQQRIVLADAEHASPIEECYREPLTQALNWLWLQRIATQP